MNRTGSMEVSVVRGERETVMDEENGKPEVLITGLDKVVKVAAVNTRTRSLADRVTALQSDFASARGVATRPCAITSRWRFRSWAKCRALERRGPKRKISEWLADSQHWGPSGWSCPGCTFRVCLSPGSCCPPPQLAGRRLRRGWHTTHPYRGGDHCDAGVWRRADFSACTPTREVQERFRMAREIFLVCSRYLQPSSAFISSGQQWYWGRGENVQQLD